MEHRAGHVHELLEVRTHNLISVHKNDPIQVEGEENIEKQDLICPYHTLFLCLLAQPFWPGVGD